MAFRISVSLNTFFNDQRSLSYILIDSRFKTIEDLEEHIKVTFGINNDSDICLLSNNHLLPSPEGIDILCPNESIIVVPVKNEFYVKKLKKTQTTSKDQNNKRTHSVSETDVDFESKDNFIESFMKCKKTNRDCPESNANQQILKYNDMDTKIDNRLEESSSNNIPHQIGQSNKPTETYKRNAETVINNEKTENDNKAIKIINIENVGHMEISQATQPVENSNHLENKFNMNSISEKNSNCFYHLHQHKISSNKPRKSNNIPFTVGNLLSLSNHNFDLDKKTAANATQSENEDLTLMTPAKKRKRVRVRKSKKKCPLPFFDTTTPISDHDTFEMVETKPPKPKHIRFEEEKDNFDFQRSNEQALINMDTSKLYKNNIDENIISKNMNCTSNGYSNHNDAPISNGNIKNIFEYLDLTKPDLNLKTTSLIQDVPPKIGDILAFKLYEFNDNYEPIISNWVIGRVINYNGDSKDVDFEILAGRIQTTVPFGKFNIPEDDIVNEQNDVTLTQLNYISLVDPKLVTLSQ